MAHLENTTLGEYMPYLTKTDFNSPCGELNRAITELFISCTVIELKQKIVVLLDKYTSDQKPRYETFNNVIGALECALLEYKRRMSKKIGLPTQKDSLLFNIVFEIKNTYYDSIIAPYEDKKIIQHGDVYDVK